MRAVFYVDMDNLTEIEAALSKTKDKSKMVLKTAINNAAKKIENSMVTKAKAKYHFKKGNKGDIRKANTVKKANTGKLEATVEAKGDVNELLDFQVKPRDYFPRGKYIPEWVKARALRGAKLTKVALRPNARGDKYKAFVIRYNSGHLALAQRVPGKRMKSKPHKEAVKSLLSISTPKMEETVYRAEIEEDMHDILMKNIEEQIQRFLK